MVQKLLVSDIIQKLSNHFCAPTTHSVTGNHVQQAWDKERTTKMIRWSCMKITKLVCRQAFSQIWPAHIQKLTRKKEDWRAIADARQTGWQPQHDKHLTL
jgi:hypothetical protein